MPNIIEATRQDIRDEFPKLMAALGVNTSNEHQVFHSTLIWLVREVGKLAEAFAEASTPAGVVADVGKVAEGGGRLAEVIDFMRRIKDEPSEGSPE